MTLHFWSSCFHLLSAGIIGLYHYTWIMWSWRQNSGPFSYSASTLNWAIALTPGERTVLKMKRAYYIVFVNEDCLKLTKILILVMNGNTLWYHRPSSRPGHVAGVRSDIRRPQQLLSLEFGHLGELWFTCCCLVLWAPSSNSVCFLPFEF